MSEIRFKSSLPIEEVDENFKNTNFYTGIMEGLNEALAYEKGKASAETQSVPDTNVIDTINALSVTQNNFFNKFHIGTYYLQKNARDEKHVADMKECGINLIFGIDNNKPLLDLFQKHGIQAVVSGVVPGWFGGNGSNAGTMRQTRKKQDYADAIFKFSDHPAIVGIDIGDEPSSLDFPWYGQIVDLINKLLPQKFPYLNIYPSYGMLGNNDDIQIQKELGTSTYSEYINSYISNINLPYLSFDHYVYTTCEERLFNDLNLTATYCKNSNKKLIVTVQVNSRDEEIFLAEEQLCFQAFSAMAYGATAIIWACYSAGWWYNHVIDSEGNKTKQYYRLKNVNHKILSLADEYIKYKWISSEIIRNECSLSFDNSLSVITSTDILVGKFDGKLGTKALFVSPIKYQTHGVYTLSLSSNKNQKVIVHKCDGRETIYITADTITHISISNSQPCILTLLIDN